jgi:hypothetical protein
MTKDEALRMGMDALVSVLANHKGAPVVPWNDALDGMKAALEVKDEPWSPVSIGVDMTEAGAHVVGIYAMSDETSQIFYAKHHPASQRTWVGLTDEEIKAFDTWHDNREEEVGWVNPSEIVAYIEAKLKEKNDRTL